MTDFEKAMLAKMDELLAELRELKRTAMPLKVIQGGVRPALERFNETKERLTNPDKPHGF